MVNMCIFTDTTGTRSTKKAWAATLEFDTLPQTEGFKLIQGNIL